MTAPLRVALRYKLSSLTRVMHFISVEHTEHKLNGSESNRYIQARAYHLHRNNIIMILLCNLRILSLYMCVQTYCVYIYNFVVYCAACVISSRVSISNYTHKLYNSTTHGLRAEL